MRSEPSFVDVRDPATAATHYRRQRERRQTGWRDTPEWQPQALALSDEATEALRRRAVWLRDVVRAEPVETGRLPGGLPAPLPLLRVLPATWPAWLAARYRLVRALVRARFERFGPRSEPAVAQLPVLSAVPSPC